MANICVISIIPIWMPQGTILYPWQHFLNKTLFKKSLKDSRRLKSLSFIKSGDCHHLLFCNPWLVNKPCSYNSCASFCINSNQWILHIGNRTIQRIIKVIHEFHHFNGLSSSPFFCWTLISCSRYKFMHKFLSQWLCVHKNEFLPVFEIMSPDALEISPVQKFDGFLKHWKGKFNGPPRLAHRNKF